MTEQWQQWQRKLLGGADWRHVEDWPRYTRYGTFALVWVVFAVLLVGRARFGWRGLHATRMVYAGAVMLLLGYAGSRFVLEVLLGHGA